MTIRMQQEESIETPKTSGSSGGMSGGDYSAIGSQAHQNTLSTMSWFQQNEKMYRDEQHRKQLAAEEKRRWDIENTRANNAQGAQGLTMMQNSIDRAQASTARMSFKNALKNSFLGGV
jgi:hypothetical protein